MLERTGWIVVCVAAVGGCQAAFEHPPQAGLDKLLRPVTTAPDSVKLEIFHARIPPNEQAKASTVWSEVDEGCLDAELRGRLVANGLRAGVVGGTLPAELARLLDMKATAPSDSGKEIVTAASAAPHITRRVVQVNRRGPITIIAAELRDEAHVLFGEEGRVSGGVYRQVEAVYSLRAESIEGQRVRVRVTPELNHGELRDRFAGSSEQGIFLKMPSREREVFDRLSMAVDLSPGEILVLGCVPEVSGSLGHVFHTSESSGAKQPKLILVRLLETPPSEILASK